ncbi:B-cell receptor CD22 isoform X2 [Pangasianodon hypophthalmus]|uniref:B-cell receptor CD22 isoform X2 n=1 Tax=Pangasianodon hypophthalmus TaxID=310915 RepID=UPI000EFF1855|nr:B-cell receptor CD22 isoform X2 [Pangasianodon hypophthalmus]
MYSVWKSVLLWVLFCLFSSIAAPDKSNPSIVITGEKATRQEGSCVTIECKYRYKEEMQLFWLKDPEWNTHEKRFDGKIVYSNTSQRPQVSEYSGRVEFELLNEIGYWAPCTLTINDLKKNDSGNYTFRYIKGDDKYIGNRFHLTVTDNPCKVHIKPPNFNKSLKEGDNVSLHCATSAACESYPKWQSSGSSEVLTTEDTEEKRSELKLTVNWTDDRRILTCSSGSHNDNCLDRTVTLRVEYAPKETKVLESSSSKDVKEGEQVTISCSSKAHPNANFTWFRRQTSFSKHGENLTLHIMTPEDGGIFYCEAKNKHGRENSTDIKINVIYAPKGVTISHQSNDLREGDQLTLTCSVQNSNPAVGQWSYKWYKDDQEINHQTMNTFTVQSITRFDKGRYQCQAGNSVGETKSAHSTQVSVQFVPQNTHIKGENSIKLGFHLKLECVTEADPLPNNYCWYFKPENDHRFLSLSYLHQAYHIENVTVSNGGSYKCSAQNVIGAGANSTDFSVVVLYAPKKLNLTMKQVVKEAESYTITCSVESSPRSVLTLCRSSLTNPEKDKETLKTVHSNFLSLTAKATMSDAGVYTCTAKNTEGEDSLQHQLKVLYAPKNVKVSAYPGEVLNEGSNLTLTCTADSVPQVSAYMWKKSIGKHSVTLGLEQTITFHFLKSSDSDHYFCISSNEIGSAKPSSVYIRVKYQPRITIIHNMTSLSIWEKAAPIHLSCSVQCDPPADLFEWYKLEENTTVLSYKQNYTVQPENPGTYYCYASNEVGKSRSEPVKILLNYFIIKRLIQVIISLLVILFLIGVMFLLQRIVLRKRSSGKNEAAQRSFFFSPAPLWSLSNLHSSGSRNNITENLVMEESTERSGFRDNHSATAVHSNPPANRNKQAGRLTTLHTPNSNINTVYDAVKLPPSMLKQHHHTEEDLTMTTVNYAMLQFMDSKNPNKSVPSRDGCGPVYAEVSKNKQMAKKRQDGHEDYENVSGACAPKQPFPNINWDSDTSESEEEVNYTKVSFTVTSHHDPQMYILGSDEEDKTEYSEIKV